MGPRLKKKFDNERGQSMVIFAVALVGLLAFVALAADTGQLYVERRNAQSAADSAAFAAASAKVKKTNLTTAGLQSAASNGFDNDGTTNTVSVYNPPQTSGYDSTYIEVIISSRVDTSFLHLFGRKSIVNTSSAIVHVQTDVPAFGDDALVATKSSGCNTFANKGNITIKVLVGNIFINSSGDGSDTACGFYINANSGEVTLSDGTIRTVGTGIDDKHSIVSLPTGSSLATSQTQVDYSKKLPAPNCSLWSNFSTNSSFDLTAKSASGNATLSPGVYSSISNKNKQTITLNPGLYCITGPISIKGTITGSNVLLVMQSGSSLEMAAQGGATLSAYSLTNELTSTTGKTVDYKGMLIMDGGTTGPFDFEAGSDSTFTGTIYVPDSICTLGGNSGVKSTLKSQIICSTFLLHGTPDLQVSLVSDAVFHSGGSIDLMQ